MIVLDYRDSRPLYQQVKDSLRRMMLTGLLEPDEKLPSVRSLATQLAINPNTIQRAYRELEAEGYICSVPGRGSFVCQQDAALEARRAELLSRWPNTELRPRRTQTGFAERYIYAVASPGTRRIKGAPEHYVLLSVVLPEPSGSARVAVIAEASPHRFTHHIVIGSSEDMDGEAMGLAALSHAFALERGGGR